MRRIAAAFLLIASTAGAADWHVDDSNATGTEQGSALRPFRTIGQAVAAAAAAGDRILVASGSYPPFTIDAKSIDVLGGYPGNSTAGYASNAAGNFSARDAAANVATIQGTPADACVQLLECPAGSIDGFTITGGGGSNLDEYRSQGGGVFVRGGAPAIRGCTIEDNDARDAKLSSFGGGIHAENSGCAIEDNRILGNTADRGGGISVSGGMPVIRGNLVEANIGTGDHGGGMYIFSPNVLIERNNVRGNEIGRELGYGWGGGIIVFNPGANATLRFNRVTGNYAPSRGPGVFIDEGATALMEHCIVANNTAVPDAGMGAVYVDGSWDNIPSALTMRHCTIYGHDLAEPTLGGNGVFVDSLSSATIENCIIWGNAGESIFAVENATFALSYSTVEESLPGTGNIIADPLFADPAAGDFHLKSRGGRWNGAAWVNDTATSPALDAANPASPYALEPAYNGGRANQGAYGNTPEASRTYIEQIFDGTSFTVY